MRGNLVPITLLFLALASGLGIAWLSQNPEAPVLRRAEGWPIVGPVATWFREAYRPPAPTPEWRETTTPGGPGARRPPHGYPEILETSDGVSPPWPGPPEWVWVLPDTVLRTDPSQDAPIAETMSSIANLPRIERRGDWFKVWRQRELLWVHLPDHPDDDGPPLGSEPDPPGPLWPRGPDADKLAAARSLLGEREQRGTLGPYDLYTDIGDGDLLTWLETAVEGLEPAYVERYGRNPLGTPEAAVVLFADEAAYRILQLQVDRLVGLHAAGHNSRGLAALFVGGLPRDEVAATLLHELVHFLNRRALGPALPPWLDEGLCDDLAGSRVGEDGGIRPRELGGRRVRREWGMDFTAASASLWSAHQANREGKLPPLRTLLSLDWDAFVRSDQSRRHYDLSALFVRFLIDGDGGRNAEGFRAYLDTVANGGDVGAETLRSHLDRPWDDLDESFRTWITTEARKLLQ